MSNRRSGQDKQKKRPVMPKRQARTVDRKSRIRQEKFLDEALANTFPASDPVSSVPTVSDARPDR
jgi:hypothetical protein